MIRKNLFSQKTGLPLLFSGLVVTAMSCGKTSGVTLKDVRAQDVWQHIEKNSEASAVLVNVWATWCVPCVEELPMILDLENEFGPAELEVYLVSVDWLDEREMAIDFLEKNGVSGMSFIKNQDDNEFIASLWSEWTGAVPFTMIYSKSEGKVVDYWEGKKSREHFVSAIKNVVQSRRGGA